MVIYCIVFGVLVLTLACVGAMLFHLKDQPGVKVSWSDGFKLVGSGVIAFIADTVGVGSFAVNVALAKALGTFRDEELPAMLNGAQVIPGMIESFFFMNAVDVDLTTLLTLVAGTCVGGLLGGGVVSRLSQQAIRLSMMGCFLLIMGLLAARAGHVFPAGGDVMSLHAWTLVLGFVGMAVCGALTSVGIGLFAMVQGVLFLLNMSPVVAFPIMMTAGAMQQPLTTLVFVKQGKIPLKRTLILSLGGCLGVAIILPLFHYLTVGNLHFLLFLILAYNLIAITRTYLRTRFVRVGSTQVAQ